jgi:hypothetical protein
MNQFIFLASGGVAQSERDAPGANGASVPNRKEIDR